MEKIIAFCGINCTDCQAFIATQENNDVKRREIAQEWSKAFGHEIKPEDINCDGCLNTGGRHINYWVMCEIRKCGANKKVQNCAYCADYKCEKLAEFHKQAPKANNTLEEIRKQTHKK